MAVTKQASVKLGMLAGGATTESTNVEMKTSPKIVGEQINTEPEVSSPQGLIDQEVLVPNGGYGWVCVACVFLAECPHLGNQQRRFESSIKHT
jgi:hypothetical protein